MQLIQKTCYYGDGITVEAKTILYWAVAKGTGHDVGSRGSNNHCMKTKHKKHLRQSHNERIWPTWTEVTWLDKTDFGFDQPDSFTFVENHHDLSPRSQALRNTK